MSTAPSSAPTRSGSSRSWLHAGALWAGLSIITMWLAVLFVGIFGGDFVSSSTSNGVTKFPIVVVLLPFVLPATIAVARRGFTSGVDERRRPPGDPAARSTVNENPARSTETARR